MSKYAITAGVQDSPVKTVLYGPEGIGKSTFASHFPDPVFIDTEGGTKRLNVKRLPQRHAGHRHCRLGRTAGH